jgi:orotidine-5'-phosphate decarboxylase
VAGAVRGLASPAVRMFNVHSDGGLQMLRAAAETAASLPNRPLALGVTVLTSVDEATLHEEIRVAEPMAAYVPHLARMAHAAGLHGVVCSAHEVEAIKAVCGAEFLTVVPGMRPSWAATNDQARIMTPKDAMATGADFLVIGRPITQPPAGIGSPADAAQRILEELA